MIMKIQKKDKQLPTFKVLNHSDACMPCEHKSQSSFACDEDQPSIHHPLTITELAYHCTAHNERFAGDEQKAVIPKRMVVLNGMEDSGGGGTGVKKKRKKREPGILESIKKETKVIDIKPKRRRELKEPKDPKKAKEQKQKEPKQQREIKKPRKPRDPKPPKEKKNAFQSAFKPKTKRASKDQGPLPMERKKKGKRKNEISVDNLEQSLLNSATQSTEESMESADSQKRRSGRQVKRRKYNEDLDLKVVDDDGETIAVLGVERASALSSSALAWQAEEPPEDDANIIEKILASRMVQKEFHPGGLSSEVEEFYVKYRNFSYLHCKWATLHELEKDPRIQQKIRRFRNKQAQMKHIFTEPDEDLFNPDYVEVDRVLEVAHTKDSETGEEVTHYLVKWCSLSYEESTWELEEDVDPVKIKEFEVLQIPPEMKHLERPASEAWQKLKKSREYKNNNQLREYQLEGMNWLLFNWYNRKNCILADEMGLGKTIQSITFLSEIFLMGIRGPFLIIAPLSTITNWEREFRTWTQMNAVVYHGSQISRQMIQQYEMFYRDKQGIPLPEIFKFQVVITTFEMILADCPELKKIQWSCVIIDEAHRLKNRNCKLLEGLKLMILEHKILLTGTPLQNSVEELFSLLNFLEPMQFPSEIAFLEEFGDLKTEEQVKKLQSLLKPMMLRRLKDDVEKNLAPKQETIIEVELTNIQKKYYRAILEKNFTFLTKGANQHNMPNLINTMMELRKCCNHPYLINGAEEKILEDFRKTHSPDAVDFQLQAMIQAAGKLVLIDKLLPKLIAGGHKVLIFSQMVRCLDILEDYLIQRRYTYERIDGRVRGNMRQAAIDRFCKPDSDRFVFLLCTRAGGLGINLTAADTCIIFDSDWNPQNDLQAQARCHRIGQSKAVKVYRLITRNSYEREMFDKASLKLGLDKAVLQDINRKASSNGVQQLSKIEVEDLLRKGAYGALMDEEDEGAKFCEEDIDQILQRRTQTITIQSEGKGSTFAKASFVSSGNRTDISLDDPNFWQKWAKIAELDTDSKNEKESLVIDRPRVRKQTKHYNSFEDDELMEFSELESDTDERPTRSRRLHERTRRYLRAECFRVEKNLLIFGWGRWKDILTYGRFKWHLNEKDMEMICRALLVYCVKHYKGDEKIKSFIWDLITPTKDGQNHALQNHSGLSAPVPRGRKGKKTKNQMLLPELKNADWLVNCNPEIVLHDDSYKKHLKQHCNKVLLRVRMLYYLKAEVLGEAADKALEGASARDLDVLLPDIDYVEIPVAWWNAEADKSLLIGVYKHGYERYNIMRADPALYFLEKVGMPDETSLSAEGLNDVSQEVIERGNVSKDENNEDKSEVLEEQQEEENPASCNEVDMKREDSSTAQDGLNLNRSCWPVSSALTARLRRLITVYQRCNRKELPRAELLIPSNHGYWLQEEMLRRTTDSDPVVKEMQKRWTRREQADFYRTISSFGVIYDTDKKVFDWTQFRTVSRLEKKADESLEKYFHSFIAMCRRVCRLPLRKEDGTPDPAICVEPITEERAAKTLYRIELIRKVREQVLKHPYVHERMKLCQPSLYLPVWWECGKHDRDLLIGTAKHGLSRTDYYVMNDPQLSFLDAYRNYSQHKQTGDPGPEKLCCPYQGSSKLYNSVERTCELLENDTEYQVKLENLDDPIANPPCSSQDGSSETFLSKVRDIMSINHDDCSLPEPLMCMMYEEKTYSSAVLDGSSSEQSLLGPETLNYAEVRNEVTKSLLCKVNNDEALYNYDPEPTMTDCFLEGMEAEYQHTDNQEGEHNPLDSTGLNGHSKASPVGMSDPLQCTENMQEAEEEGSCNPGVLSLDRKIPPNQGFTGLFGDDSLENKSALGCSHSPGNSDVLSDKLEDQNRPLEEVNNNSQSNIGEGEDYESSTDWMIELYRDNVSGVPSEISHAKPTASNSTSQYKTRKTGSASHVENLMSNMEQNLNGCERTPIKKLCAPYKVGEVLSGFLKDDAVGVKEKPLEGKAEGELQFAAFLVGGDGPVQEEGTDAKCNVMEENKVEDCLCPDYAEKCSEENKCCVTALARETLDDYHDTRAPTIAQLLQEKTLYSFSEWPKDRVIINRIDNICHAVLKGKWPSSSQQFEAQSTVSAPGLRRTFSGQETQEADFSGESPDSHMQKDRFMSPAFPENEEKHKKPFEFENEMESIKNRSLEQLSSSHEKSTMVLNGWRESAMDLSRAADPSSHSTPPFSLSTSTPKLGSVNALQGSIGMDLSGILQAGLIHPVTGQIVNGSLRREDAALRRRRGRRKNVEGMDLMFMKERALQPPVSDDREDQNKPLQSTTHLNLLSTSSPQPITTTSVVAEKAAPNKSLLDWLKQQSDYTMDIPGFGSNFSDKPKQRRQRSKDPSKLDINTGTGEERVPVINKSSGRKAFLPESKFNHILTEPVLQDAGPRRRGRRPRSELIKSSGLVADTSPGMGPLFMNGLITGMDLVGLQNMRNMQGVPLTGVVGFPAGFATVPAGEDIKNTLSMLPMMLPGMATVPQMFGVGGLLNPPTCMTTTCTSTVPTSLTSTTKGSAPSPGKIVEDKLSGHEMQKESSFSDHLEPVVTPSSPVAFNPFLIPGMSHGLLYPSMYLSPGIGMALPGMQQSRHSEALSLESQRRKRKKAKGDFSSTEAEPVLLQEDTETDQNCTGQATPEKEQLEGEQFKETSDNMN
uniref:Chromodomain-helicase-DNA-binding protein 6 isoform X1 n=2 Tax=Geotrypetes seraphini TaxID=260995 RepID=A0A6P8SRF7_GEOSA|nr:chromodomain-helicase-DNA-binding protein 6 isoform X1 [Geotrypetes seraphini]XP_033818824.1 chromodomain-helicase-DNA-binding protein 6 isoform X1 [Geotrypetes seraphini]